MNLRVTVNGKVKAFIARAVEKSSLNRAFESLVVDAKPSDLHMSRLKSR